MYKYATITILLAIVTPNLSLPTRGGGGNQRWPHNTDNGNNNGQRVRSQMPPYGQLPAFDDRYVQNGGGGGGNRHQSHYPSYPQEDNQYNIMDPREPNMYTIYGMPTYRGEYKPSPYYYSQLPSLNYNEDRVESSNPLDDLHLEMMQEHERDRLRQLALDQEQYYEPNARHSPRITQAFLQNLMAYNRQVGNGGGGRDNSDQDYDSGVDREFDQNEDYYAEDNTPSDVYEPQPQFDYRYYDNTNQKYSAPAPMQKQPTPAQQKQQQQPIYRERYPATSDEHDDADESEDEEVRELKNLAHRGRGSIKHNTYDDYDFAQDQPANKEVEHDADAAEYDDSAWINWDRKRSVPQKQRENIKLLALNEQKVAEIGSVPQTMHFVGGVTQRPATAYTLPAPPSSSTAAPADYSSALSRLKLQGNHLLSHQPGQKEVLLARPDTPVRHPFAAPVMNILQQNGDKATKPGDDKENSKDIYDTIKQIVSMEDKLNQVSRGSSGHDTIYTPRHDDKSDHS